MKKKIDNFSEEYHIADSNIKHDPIELHFNRVKSLYDKRSEKCKEITKNKLANKSEQEKERVKDKRINGILPDKNDIWLVASGLSVSEENQAKVGIWSFDTDFTEFSEEIKQELSLEIFSEKLPH